jgi:polyisoprenoid-binding protein YceI
VKPVCANSLDVTRDMTIHGITRRVTISARITGARDMPGLGDFAAFETTFEIDRRDYGVLGNRWSGNTFAIDPKVEIHLIVGGVRK